MKLSFKFRPRFNQKQLKITEELSWHTTKLYNIVNYECGKMGLEAITSWKKNTVVTGIELFCIPIPINTA